jgi:hypothetical protein
MWPSARVRIGHPVSFRHTLKAALKRGALVAAANWPVTLVQAVADALFKLLIAAPLVGGVVLATLVIGADTTTLITSDWRVLVATVATSLLSHRLVLIAFLLALAVVIIGGSVFVFLVKGGTVGVLVRGERDAADVETPPLQFEVVATASSYSVELFVESAQTLFPRYVRLGFALMAVYLASAAVYLGFMLTSRSAGEGWGVATLVTIAFVVFTTIINLLYLLVQIVIAADDCGIAAAAWRVVAFLRREGRVVAGVFFVVLAMVVLSTAASIVAFAALGLISLIPVVWLAAVPLQLLAFLLRAVVFQYIGLASIGAYLKLYRDFNRGLAPLREAS